MLRITFSVNKYKLNLPTLMHFGTYKILKKRP